MNRVRNLALIVILVGFLASLAAVAEAKSTQFAASASMVITDPGFVYVTGHGKGTQLVVTENQKLEGLVSVSDWSGLPPGCKLVMTRLKVTDLAIKSLTLNGSTDGELTVYDAAGVKIMTGSYKGTVQSKVPYDRTARYLDEHGTWALKSVSGAAEAHGTFDAYMTLVGEPQYNDSDIYAGWMNFKGSYS